MRAAGGIGMVRRPSVGVRDRAGCGMLALAILLVIALSALLVATVAASQSDAMRDLRLAQLR